MKKIRIAFFIDVFKEHFDGVSNTMHQIVKRVPRDDFDVIIITPHPSDEEVGFLVYQCPYLRLPYRKGYRVGVPGFKKGLKKILDDFSPQVVHWTSPSFLGRFALKYANKRGIPVTCIYHTHFPTYGEYYFKSFPFSRQLTNALLKVYFKFYQSTDVIFAPTKPMRDYLSEAGISKESLRLWGRGVSRIQFNEEFRDESYFERVGIPKKVKKVLFVSRLVIEKETDTLIRLYELFESGGDQVKMIITGEGPDRERMEKHMPNAVFMGMRKNEELAAIYASSDVFVFPSVTETFGNVVLEAMASGLPVVAANAGGPSDIVEDGVSGFLMEPRNEKAFYTTILHLLNDEVLYAEIRQNAIDYAKKQSWNNLCIELFNTYRKLSTSE